MTRRCIIGAILFLSLFTSQARAEVKWKKVGLYLARIGLAGGAEALKAKLNGPEPGAQADPNNPNEPKIDYGREFWKGATGQLIDDGTTLLQNELANLAEVSDSYSAGANNRLRNSIDEHTTREEFNAMVGRINVEMAKCESSISDLEYRQSLTERTGEMNARQIRQLQAQQAALDQRFDSALREIDLALAEVRGLLKRVEEGLVTEIAERKAVDRQQWAWLTQLEATDRQHAARLSSLEHLITPQTRNQTATRLGIDGAMAILYRSDSIEAARTLQLAIAYDKVSNQHVDPAARYFLAVAYRRMGDKVRADETVAEAIAAQRFRRPADWFDPIMERFQCEDRQWLQAKITDPRFGVKAPRRVLLSQGK